MNAHSDELTQPAARLWRTRFRRHRKVDGLAPLMEARYEPPDPDALLRFGRVTLLEDLFVAQHRDGTITIRNHMVVALQGTAELAEWDAQSWGWDKRHERFGVRIAKAVYPDGQVVTPKASTVAYVHGPGSVDDYAKVTTLSFPHLRPGVIVELCFQHDFFYVDPWLPAMWRNFYLRTVEPTGRRRLCFAVAPPFHTRFALHNEAPTPERSEIGGYDILSWVVQDVPGVKMDGWTPPARDFVPWIDVSTLPGWKWVMERYRLELEPAGPLAELAEEITATAKTPREKLAKVYEYVTGNVRYGRHPAEVFLPLRREADSTVTDMRGDYRDKSALTKALLDALEIPCDIVVVVTAEDGRADYLPSQRFNYAVLRVRLEGETYWLDPSSENYAFGDCPSAVADVPALVMGQEALRRTPRHAPDMHPVRRSCHGRLESNGDYHFQAELSLGGEHGASMRFQLRNVIEAEHVKVVGRWEIEQITGARITRVSASDPADLLQPLELNYAVEIPRYARSVAAVQLLRIPWNAQLRTTGPLTDAEREVPLNVPPPRLLRDEHLIELPEGLAPYGLPIHESKETPWGVYRLSVELTEEGVRCLREVKHLGGMVPPERYAEYRAWWNDCARIDEMDLVLMPPDLGLR